MDIEVLRECYCLSQNLSFTQTAKRFFITQSALSRHIAALETELGVDLFIRTRNGVHLTQAGETFTSGIRKTLNTYDAAISSLRNYQEGFESEIWFGYLYGASSTFLTNAISSFVKKERNVKLHSIPLEIDEIIAALNANQISIAITSGVYAFPKERFNERRLYEDAPCLILPDKHELANRTSIRIEEAITRKDVLFPTPGPDKEEAEAFSKSLGTKNLPVAKKDSPSSVLSVEATLALGEKGILSYKHLTHMFKDSDYHFVPVVSKASPFYVRVIWEKSCENEALLNLVEEICLAFSKVPKTLHN